MPRRELSEPFTLFAKQTNNYKLFVTAISRRNLGKLLGNFEMAMSCETLTVLFVSPPLEKEY